MLKQSVLAKIYSTLEKSPFTVADFEVTPGDSEDDAILRVRFRHAPDFSFVVDEQDGKLYALESPGEYRKTEAMVLTTLHNMPERLAAWARNVRDELRSLLPAYTEIDELRDAIEKHIQEHVDHPDQPFSKAEADDLRAKLDQLGEKFVELAERSEITKQELNRLEQELVAIKTNISAYPKGTWYKTAGTKLWAVSSKIMTSTESRQVLAQAAKKLIGLDDHT
jgi:hypothetical protein